MGITLNVDTYLLCSMFNINTRKLSTEYSGMSIEEIMQAEAEQGNEAAAKFDAAVLNDPAKLMELFELKDPGNKFAILRNMNEQDLEELLPLLDQADLVTGLNFFTKDKLLEMSELLPMEELVKMTFQMFSPEQLMQLMPEQEINKVLMSTEMDKNLEIKCLQTLKPEILAQMIEASTGQPAPGTENVGLDGEANLDPRALIGQISELPDDKFQDAMLSIPPQSKKNFMLAMTQQNPKLFQLFEASAYTNIINNKKEKEDIVRSANVLKPESLVKMIEQLPKELTAVVLTQIDTKQFAQVLTNDFKSILRQVIAG